MHVLCNRNTYEYLNLLELLIFTYVHEHIYIDIYYYIYMLITDSEWIYTLSIQFNRVLGSPHLTRPLTPTSPLTINFCP